MAVQPTKRQIQNTRDEEDDCCGGGGGGAMARRRSRKHDAPVARTWCRARAVNVCKTGRWRQGESMRNGPKVCGNGSGRRPRSGGMRGLGRAPGIAFAVRGVKAARVRRGCIKEFYVDFAPHHALHTRQVEPASREGRPRRPKQVHVLACVTRLTLEADLRRPRVDLDDQNFRSAQSHHLLLRTRAHRCARLPRGWSSLRLRTRPPRPRRCCPRR